MDIKNMKKIRESSYEEIAKEILEIGEAIFTIKSKCAVSKTTARPDIIKKLKKSRARMMTHLSSMHIKNEAN